VSEIRHVFLDDGGVINDNELRQPQWQRLVGEFFAPRLGGTKEAWSVANAPAFSEAVRRLTERQNDWDASARSVEANARAYLIDWLRLMAEGVGVPSPEDDAACLELAQAGNNWIPRGLSRRRRSGERAFEHKNCLYGIERQLLRAGGALRAVGHR
jgi:hypothetical protein